MLSKLEKDYLIDLLEKGQNIPEDFKYKLASGTRSEYHFSVRNINYSSEQTTVDKPAETGSVDFTRLTKEGIVLESQSVEVEKGTTYETVLGGSPREKIYAIRNITWTIDEVIDKLFEEFEQREWEGKTLKLGDSEYTKNSLPPRKTIEDIVRLSMRKRGNFGDEIIETNVHKILSAFTPLLRKNKKKYKYAVQHFSELNKRLNQQGIKEQYIFHFLSPNSYDTFFQHLRDGSVLISQESFRCALENMLEDN